MIYRNIIFVLYCLNCIAIPLQFSFAQSQQFTQYPIKPRITTPNGSERMVAGKDYEIRWENADPDDTLELQYSIDHGTTWKRISDKATGLLYHWNPVPEEISDGCHIRLVPISPQNITGKILRRSLRALTDPIPARESSSMHRYPEGITFSPDGSKVFSFIQGSGDKNTPLIGPVFSEAQMATAFTPQRSRYTPMMWDVTKSSALHVFPTFTRRTYTRFGFNWSPSGGTDLSDTWFLGAQSWSPDGSMALIPFSENQVNVVDVRNNTIKNVLEFPKRGILTDSDRFVWTPDNKKIIGVVHHVYPKTHPSQFRPDSLITEYIVWDTESGNILHKQSTDGMSCDYGNQISNDRKRILTWCTQGEQTTVYIKDLLSGKILLSYALPPTLSIAGEGVGYFQGGDGRFWSPNDSLVYLHITRVVGDAQWNHPYRDSKILFVNTWTGKVARTIDSTPVTRYMRGSWSPQSDKFLFSVYIPVAQGVGKPNNVIHRVIEVSSGRSWSISGVGFEYNLAACPSSSPTVFGAWRPDGKRFIIRYGNMNNTFGIWDIESHKMLYYFTFPASWVSLIQWDPSGNRLLALENAGSLRYLVDLPEPLQGDTSDAVWSIVKPESLPPVLSAVERVDFGRVLCRSENRAVLSVRNTGGKPLVIRALRFEGFAGFSLETPPLLPLEIAGGAEIHIPLRVQCTTTGKFNATLLIASNASNAAERRVMLQAERQTSSLQWSRDTLDLGVVAEGVMAESRIRLNNTGTTAFELPQMLTAGRVSVEIPSRRVIEPGGSVECVVRRSGSGGGSYTERLVLRDSCGVERVLFVQIQVLSGRWSVTPEQRAIELGAESDIGVFVQNRQGIKPGMEIRAALRIENATVVGCIAPQAIERNYDAAHHIERLTVRDTIRSAAESEAVMRLRLLALQGNDTATAVAVERVWVSGVELSASGNARQAKIVVTGINEAGGLRRLYPASLRLLSLAPNPAHDNLLLELQTSSTKPATITIADLYGRTMQTLHCSLTAGFHRVQLPLHSKTPGLYTLMLRQGDTLIQRLVLVER